MAYQKYSILETPIYTKIYNLYRLFHLYYPNIPKSKRYTVWKKCENKILELLETLIASSHLRGEKRIDSLNLMSQKVDILKVLVRLAKETDTIQLKEYLTLETHLQEIGRMIGGWIKSVPH